MHTDFSSRLARSVNYSKRNYSSLGDTCNAERYELYIFVLRMTNLPFLVCSG